MTFRALTFNMQNGQPWDEGGQAAINLEATAAFLKSQRADVIFLQEVEQGFDGGAQIEPPPHYTFLKQALEGYDSVFGYPPRNPVEIPFGLGLATFSLTPLGNFQKVILPAAAMEFEFGGTKRRPSERILLRATTEIGGREVVLLNTHLQAFFMIGASSAEHLQQRDLVEAELRKSGGAAILAGDLNSAPGEGVVEQFASAGFRTVQNTEITWRRKPFVLDHLFYNGGLEVRSHEVIPTLCSDHHAVLAEFRIL